ncbi:MAG TPA: gfo/Idh/MocA family oxidoreductase [Clostridiales bacterium]|jgi:predicted dehydrogenase|nr:gfo/Idh/MocA family oxidoreductase [Clostridiales bacterium]HCG35308.1 gfo/Idh/MocA family oxidoreductase [Clostridiales bacterium]
MLKAALIGVGSMGRGHLDNYVRYIQEEKSIRLVAICDVDPKKFTNYKGTLNIKGVGAQDYDFSMFHLYTDMDEMLEKEELDMVSIILPTYLHCEATLKCLAKGLHVFCEKPMALNPDDCTKMIEAAKKTGKYLMIGQCLRFWHEYVALKDLVNSGKFGKPLSAYFFRGGSTPLWSYQNWLLKEELGGGALFDQHVHDIDMIQYLFGMPKAVSSRGVRFYEGSGYDAVTTNYIYDQNLVVNAQDDWFLATDSFEMIYRVNFEGGTAFMDAHGFRFTTRDGEDVTPTFTDSDKGYYHEILYFAGLIENQKENTINPPESSRDTIRILMAEKESCDQGGAVVKIK